MVDTSSLEKFLETGLGRLTLGQVLGAAAVLAVCLVVSRLLLKLLGRLTEKSTLDPRVRTYLFKGARSLLYVLTALITADSLGIPVTSLVALVSVFALAVSLAVQDVLSNVAGGLVILFSKPFTLGDYVAAAEGEGTVEEISLTHTKLDTPNGQRVMLPNSRLVAGQIVNYSVRGVRRADPDRQRLLRRRAGDCADRLPPGGGAHAGGPAGPGAGGGADQLRGERHRVPCPLLDQNGGLLGRPFPVPGGAAPRLRGGRRDHDI